MQCCFFPGQAYGVRSLWTVEDGNVLALVDKMLRQVLAFYLETNLNSRFGHPSKSFTFVVDPDRWYVTL